MRNLCNEHYKFSRALVVIILGDVQSIVIVLLVVIIIIVDFSFHLFLLGEAKIEQLCCNVVVVALQNKRTSKSLLMDWKARVIVDHPIDLP